MEGSLSTEHMSFVEGKALGAFHKLDVGILTKNAFVRIGEDNYINKK